MMQRLLPYTLLIIALVMAGCGGQGPQIGSGMLNNDSNFGFGSSSSSNRTVQNKLAASFWNIEQLKRQVTSEELAASSEKVGEVEIVIKEVVYEGERWEGNQTKIFAFFAYPVKPKGIKLPAVLHIHGAGQTASKDTVKDWASRGYAALSIDLPGHGPSREESRSTGPDMSNENIFKCVNSAKESWLFPAVCAAVQGITFLSKQEVVDPFRLGVYGYGWGGVISLITNGMDNRIRAACSVYGAGYIGEGGAWVDDLKKLPEKQRKMWLETFDPSQYIKSRNGAVLYLSATGEPEYPMANLMKCVKNTLSEKRFALTPNSKKADELVLGNIPLWFDWALRSGSEFPKVQTQLKDNKLNVISKGGRPAVKAVLNYKNVSNGKWESLEGKPEKGICAFTLPSGPLTYYVSVTDDRGGVVSTETASYKANNVKTASNRR